MQWIRGSALQVQAVTQDDIPEPVMKEVVWGGASAGEARGAPRDAMAPSSGPRGAGGDAAGDSRDAGYAAKAGAKSKGIPNDDAAYGDEGSVRLGRDSAAAEATRYVEDDQEQSSGQKQQQHPRIY